MYRETKELYEFGPFRLDVKERTLAQSDGSKNYILPEKAFQTLCVLVQRRGHLLTKHELLSEIWPDSFVEENNLDKCIHAIRQALGEKPGEKKYIETVRKHGYRFVAVVNSVGTLNGGSASVLDSEFLNEWKEGKTSSEPVISTSTTQSGAFVVSAKWNSEDDGNTLPGNGDSHQNSAVSEPAPVFIPQRTFRTLRSPLLAATLFLAVAIGVGYFIYPFANTAADDIKEFAVLPVKPIDPANRNDLYEIGIADSLIQRLSAIDGFIVRPLSATRKYTVIDQDPIAAGREQKVDYVLVSNYQIADGRIRITSQLFNVQSGLVEGSFKVEQENSTIFAVQDAVAANIGGPLLKILDRESNGLEEKRYTTNEEAYRLYIQGTNLVGKRTQESSRKAIENLERAVALDPNYALAYARLGHAYNTQVYTGGTKNGDEDYLKAKAAIEKALAIDPELAEAHSYLGEMKIQYDADLAGAERHIKLALELNPNSSTAHREYAELLSKFGRFDEAIAEIKTAIDLEPATQVNHHTYGAILFFARRYDEAITVEQRVVEMDPKYYFAYNMLNNSYRMKGEDERAFEAFVQMSVLSGDEPDEINSLKAIYARSGWRGISERELEIWKEREKKGNRNYNRLAFHSIELGQFEEAFAYLEKALVEDRSSLFTLKVNPRYDPLRSDPRFDDLVGRVGLK